MATTSKVLVHSVAPRVRVGVECKDKSMARSDMAEECDINNIVKRYSKTGQLPVSVGDRMPRFGEAPVMSFHEGLNMVIAAREAFSELPAAVRKRFGNDPGALIGALEAAVGDEGLRKELVDLGVLNAPPPPEPVPEPAPAPAEPAPAQ